MTISLLGCGGGSPPAPDGGTGGGSGSGGRGTGGTAGTDGGRGGTGASDGGSGGTVGTGGRDGGVAGTGGSGGSGGGGNPDGGTGSGGTGVSCTGTQGCALPNNVSGICANSTCQVCVGDSACQTAYGTDRICVDGNCVVGNCQQNGQCNGQICNTATHMCNACASSAACVTAYGAGRICQGGACITGACQVNSECPTGQICNSSFQCVGCGTSDSACTTAYGAGFICASGGCVMGTCHNNSECSNGQICNSSHVCAACPDDTSCGAGRICEGGLCINGNCHTNMNCSNGQVCVNNSCTACTGNSQCGSGQVCLPSGCTPGNCLNGSDCSASQVCKNNNCSPCASDGECASTAGGHGTDHLCSGSGACVPGNCRTAGQCAAGSLICNTTTLFCGPCMAHAQCASEYNGAYLCNGGTCIPGNCLTTAACGSGPVCNLANHTCEACSSDAQCADTANYGANHICQGMACITGNCHVAADCNNSQQICTNFTCGACSTTLDCTNAYGANHVCSAGACLSGNCNTSADCAGSNQVCNTATHSCEACATDGQCLGEVQYGPMHICLKNSGGTNGQCVPGNCHNTSADCTGSQVCNSTTHLCGSCAASDAVCKADPVYGNAYICLAAGGCAPGDCHDTSTECTAGQICGVSLAHTCGACASGATGDTQCTTDPRYGSGNICYQGNCSVGNCHATSADCTGGNAGFICGVSTTNSCGTCSSDSQCKADSFYGANTICNTSSGASQGKCVSAACSTNNAACAANGADFCCGNSCVPGNCCNDNDCATNPNFGLGFACGNNNCTQCNNVSGNRYFVDPVNGNDLTANGSGMSGAMAAPGCAFKTITRAMQVIPASPPAGTKIILVGQSGVPTGLSAGDNLPIILPTNVTLTTQGGPITITLPANANANNPSGFRLLNNGSSISGDPAAPLTLNGNNHVSGIAIQVAPTVGTNVVSVSNVNVINTNGDGIRVTNGTLNIGGGVVVTSSNQDGLRVTGGVANITNLSGTQTLFGNNVSNGIEVSALGSVNITGTPGAPVPSNNGTVVVSFNSAAGIRILQTPGGAGLLSTLDGVVSWGNGNRDLLAYGGAKLKLRNSVLGAGPTGITVINNGNTAAGNDLANIDLGTAADLGRNYIQVPNGALGRHASSGICATLAANQAAQTIKAAGNFLTTTGNPGTQLNCATGGGTVSKATNCNNGISFGETTPASTTVTVDVTMCN